MDQPIEEDEPKLGMLSTPYNAKLFGPPRLYEIVRAQLELGDVDFEHDRRQYLITTLNGREVPPPYKAVVIKEEKDEAAEVHFSFSRDGCVDCADCGSFGCLFKEVKCKKESRKEEPK